MTQGTIGKVTELLKEAMAAQSCCEELKAAGATYCFCDACTAGGKILDIKAEILG